MTEVKSEQFEIPDLVVKFGSDKVKRVPTIADLEFQFDNIEERVNNLMSDMISSELNVESQIELFDSRVSKRLDSLRSDLISSELRQQARNETLESRISKRLVNFDKFFYLVQSKFVDSDDLELVSKCLETLKGLVINSSCDTEVRVEAKMDVLDKRVFDSLSVLDQRISKRLDDLEDFLTCEDCKKEKSIRLT